MQAPAEIAPDKANTIPENTEGNTEALFTLPDEVNITPDFTNPQINKTNIHLSNSKP